MLNMGFSLSHTHGALAHSVPALHNRLQRLALLPNELLVRRHRRQVLRVAATNKNGKRSSEGQLMDVMCAAHPSKSKSEPVSPCRSYSS